MQLLPIFQNFTGYHNTAATFGLLPYPSLTGNATQRLTVIKFFMNALGGDVSRSASPDDNPWHLCSRSISFVRMLLDPDVLSSPLLRV